MIPPLTMKAVSVSSITVHDTLRIIDDNECRRLQRSSTFEARANLCSILVVIPRDLTTCQHRADIAIATTHLLVEDTVAFVDVGNVPFVLVVALPRELALLVDATDGIRLLSR